MAPGLNGLGETSAEVKEPLLTTSTVVVPLRNPPVARFASTVTCAVVCPFGSPANSVRRLAFEKLTPISATPSWFLSLSRVVFVASAGICLPAYFRIKEESTTSVFT